MRVPDSIKAGAYTALFSFITLFGLSLVGWLNDVVEWASSDGTTVFPDASGLAKAGASAATAALIGLVNTVIRWAQDQTGVGPETPDYTPPAA